MLYLSNFNGGFALFNEKANSRYHGLFWADQNEMYRVVEDISLKEKNTPVQLKGNQTVGTRTWQNGIIENFRYTENTLVYEKNTNRSVAIPLDLRRAYDGSKRGFDYKIQAKGEQTIVTLQKFDGDRFLYTLTVVISCIGNTPRPIEKWQPRKYELDQARENTHTEHFVYELLETSAKQIVITVNCKAQKAIAEHRAVLERLKDQKISTSDATGKVTPSKALRSLICEMHGRHGVLAGHPWFFQYWTRDEAISLKAVTMIGETKIAKEILLHLCEQIDDEGRIANRLPEADLGCADGEGWVFIRLYELYKQNLLTESEIETVGTKLQISLNRLEQHLMRDGLVINRPQETWIDTEYRGDVRAGARIEINALTYIMRRFHQDLAKTRAARQKAEQMREDIQKAFWNGEYIRDGANDERIRPNVFLAYYIAPDLFDEEKWLKTFDSALEELWLPWGGLASIEKSSSLYCQFHSGQNNHSYHRGDSWYFVNNLAAIAMLRLNKKYVHKAEMIHEASRKDFLELGAFGGCSEISSAARQTGEGCLNQAWSAATLIELEEEVKK
jgi:glycogen debranching enzyme